MFTLFLERAFYTHFQKTLFVPVKIINKLESHNCLFFLQFEITPQLRKLILQGVPSQYRAYLWQKLIHYYVADMRRNCGESYYEAILRQQEVKKDQKVREDKFFGGIFFLF